MNILRISKSKLLCLKKAYGKTVCPLHGEVFNIPYRPQMYTILFDCNLQAFLDIRKHEIIKNSRIVQSPKPECDPAVPVMIRDHDDAAGPSLSFHPFPSHV